MSETNGQNGEGHAQNNVSPNGLIHKQKSGAYPQTQRGVHRKTRWYKQFCVTLAETCNVSEACRVANVNPATAYKHKNDNPLFAAEWVAAIERATDILEQEARRRALHGVARVRVSKGEVVFVWRDQEGRIVEEPINQEEADAKGLRRVPLVEHEYSDVLMITLLKAHRAVFRDKNVNVTHSGSVDVEHTARVRRDVNALMADPAAHEAAMVLAERMAALLPEGVAPLVDGALVEGNGQKVGEGGT